MKSRLMYFRRSAMSSTFLLLFSACRLVNMNPLEVTAVEPDSALIDEPSRLEAVTLTFSAAADQPRVESAFSLSGDGTVVNGRFSWQNNSLRFAPYEPFEYGKDYVISLTADAQDLYGNAILRDFEHEFTTRTDTSRPAVIAMYPEAGERIATSGESIRVEFSHSVDRRSFYDAFTISPDIPFAVDWKEGTTVAAVRPMQALIAQQEYTVTLSKALADERNNALAEQFEHIFIAGEPPGDPQLVSVTASCASAPESWPGPEDGGHPEGNSDEEGEAPSLTLHPDSEPEADVEPVARWETFWDIAMKFNVPVKGSDLEAALEMDPEIAYTLEPEHTESAGNPGFSRRWVITTPKRLEYDRRHTLRLNGSIRDEHGAELELSRFAVFRTDGPGSVPPSVESVRFLLDPSRGEISEPLSDGDELDLSGYPADSDGETTGFFDLYLSLAHGAKIDPFAAADLFSIFAENLAASFELVGIQTSTAGDTRELDPKPVGFSPEHADEHEHVLRVLLRIEDNEASGLVRMTIDDAFADTYGNVRTAPWRLRLNQVSAP